MRRGGGEGKLGGFSPAEPSPAVPGSPAAASRTLPPTGTRRAGSAHPPPSFSPPPPEPSDRGEGVAVGGGGRGAGRAQYRGGGVCEHPPPVQSPPPPHREGRGGVPRFVLVGPSRRAGAAPPQRLQPPHRGGRRGCPWERSVPGVLPACAPARCPQIPPQPRLGLVPREGASRPKKRPFANMGRPDFGETPSPQLRGWGAETTRYAPRIPYSLGSHLGFPRRPQDHHWPPARPGRDAWGEAIRP